MKTTLRYPVGYPSKSYGFRRGIHSNFVSAFNAARDSSSASSLMTLFEIKEVAITHNQYKDDFSTAHSELNLFSINTVVINHNQYIEDASAISDLGLFEINDVVISHTQYIGSISSASSALNLFEIVDV